MDPMQMAMMMMQQQGGMRNEHPLTRAFGGTPMYGGVPIQPSQMFDLSGIPGFQGNTPMGMMTGMLMQGLLPQMMGPNFTPGQFAPTQNLMDHRRALQYMQQRQQAIQTASQADTDSYFRMIRGMARMRGIEYAPGGEQEASAKRFAGDIATGIMPMMANMFPDLVDRMSGARGSAAVMTRGMFEGGRYTFDPVSGKLGMSGESAGAMSRQVYEMLYGPGRDISAMQGLGAGRVGQMYDEIVRRGYGPRVAVDEAESRDMLRQELRKPISEIKSPELAAIALANKFRKGGLEKEPGGGLASISDELQKLDPQALEAAQRSFNATRVTQSIERMRGAVSAMRDIFGDMGRPNAPMVELLNGLQAMTQGGMSHMTGQQLEKSVRETYAIAKYTGLGLEGMMGFMGTAAQTLGQMGMNQASAPQIGQSAAAYGFGYGQIGQPVNFGAIDKEKATQMDIRLRAQALQSPQAVRLAALMRFSDEFTRADGEKGFAKDTEAYAMSEAVRKGATTYDYGGRKGISVFKTMGEMSTILGRGGVSEDDSAAAMTANPAAAQRVMEQYRLQDVVRQGQGRLDVDPVFGRIMASAAGVSLKGMVPDARRGALASKLGPALQEETRKLMEEDPSFFDRGQEWRRSQELAKRLQARLGPDAAGLTQAQLSNVVSSAHAAAEGYIHAPGSHFRQYGSYIGTLQVTSARAETLRQKTMVETAAFAAEQKALSGLGQEGVVGRLSDFLQEVEPGGANIESMIYSAAGGIPQMRVAAAANRELGAARDKELGRNPEVMAAKKRFDAASTKVDEQTKLIKQLKDDKASKLDIDYAEDMLVELKTAQGVSRGALGKAINKDRDRVEDLPEIKRLREGLEDTLGKKRGTLDPRETSKAGATTTGTIAMNSQRAVFTDTKTVEIAAREVKLNVAAGETGKTDPASGATHKVVGELTIKDLDTAIVSFDMRNLSPAGGDTRTV